MARRRRPGYPEQDRGQQHRFQQGGYTVVNATLGYKVSERIDTRLNFNQPVR